LSDGVDIVETWNKRDFSIGYQARFKAEVNIIGAISPEDIVGIGRLVDGQFELTRSNPNYKTNKERSSIVNNQALHLAGLFKYCKEKKSLSVPIKVLA